MEIIIGIIIGWMFGSVWAAKTIQQHPELLSELTQNDQPENNSNDLDIQEIHGEYYAWFGNEFIGQARSKEDVEKLIEIFLKGNTND